MKQQEILFFLGSACVVVFAWIAFTIIHSSLTSTISGAVNQAIIPIQPTFNTKVIDAMKKRPVVVPAYTIQPPSQNTIIVASSSGGTIPLAIITPSPTESATTGGTLQ